MSNWTGKTLPAPPPTSVRAASGSGPVSPALVEGPSDQPPGQIALDVRRAMWSRASHPYPHGISSISGRRQGRTWLRLQLRPVKRGKQIGAAGQVPVALRFECP